MRWPVKHRPIWQKWFAWHPVRIGEEWVWWEIIERRLIDIGIGGHCYDYRLDECVGA